MVLIGPAPWRQGPMNSCLLVCTSVFPSVCNAFFSELALRIYLKLCMKVGGYKCWKVTESDFPEKLWNSRYGVISAEKCWKMDSFRIFFKTTKDFAIIGNLDAPDGCLSYSIGPVFWKTLDLELWIISGWSRSSLDSILKFFWKKNVLLFFANWIILNKKMKKKMFCNFSPKFFLP